jgi:hypothetical protein
MAILGRVLEQHSEARGVDVAWDVVVPANALNAGQAFELQVPRRLPCARCEGGGCDACGRCGAIELRAVDAPVEIVTVTLSQSGSGKVIRVRVPERGGAGRGAEPRGHLLVIFREGAEPTPGVVCVNPAPPPRLVPLPWLLLPVLLGLLVWWFRPG